MGYKILTILLVFLTLNQECRGTSYSYTPKPRNYISFGLGMPFARELIESNFAPKNLNLRPTYSLELGHNFKHLSLGIEVFYINFNNTHKFMNIHGSYDGLYSEVKFKSKGLLVKISKRFSQDGFDYHFGLGGGISQNQASDMHMYAPTNKSIIAKARTSTKAALSAFGGIDYKVTSRTFIGVYAKFMRVGPFTVKEDLEEFQSNGILHIGEVGLNIKMYH